MDKFEWIDKDNVALLIIDRQVSFMGIVCDPLLPEIVEVLPSTTTIRGDGETDAWDDADFCAAVKAAGEKQVIIGRIAADVSRLRAKLLSM